MKKFKAGDIVQLKPGGPEMIVTVPPLGDVGTRQLGSECYCEWFDKGESRSKWFSHDSLVKVEEEKE